MFTLNWENVKGQKLGRNIKMGYKSFVIVAFLNPRYLHVLLLGIRGNVHDPLNHSSWFGVGCCKRIIHHKHKKYVINNTCFVIVQFSKKGYQFSNTKHLTKLGDIELQSYGWQQVRVYPVWTDRALELLWAFIIYYLSLFGKLKYSTENRETNANTCMFVAGLF